MLNGVDRLIMMKVDVLDHMEEIQVCTKYMIDGKETEKLPFDLIDKSITPVYNRMPGWNCHVDGLIYKIERSSG